MLFKKGKDKTKPYLPTSEEFFVKKYFEDRNIKYEAEYTISKLHDDKKAFRKADFYLLKYGVFVEYFGMYNSTKEIRADYDEKVRVYLKNNLPTVILYPHELGFLDYAFHTKILKVLRLAKFKKSSNLFKYKLNRYLSIGKGYYFFLSLVAFILSICFFSKEESNLGISDVLIGLVLGIYTIYLMTHFIFGLIDFFYYDE